MVPIAFDVFDPGESPTPYTVRGALYLPPGGTTCASVQLMMHGFSYGAYVWDLPGRPDYSYARSVAAAGYPVVVVDLLGYGTSDRPNGYTLSNQAYAAMAAQMVEQLRAGSYRGQETPTFERVILGGHSIGGEIAELSAGTFGGVDALIPMAIAAVVTDEAREAYMRYNLPQTATSDYIYWWTPDVRDELFYQADLADPEVIAEDRSLAQLVPSGQALSVFARGREVALERIEVPVLLVFAEGDEITPVEAAEEEAAKFTGSDDVSVFVVPRAGHTFPLHRNRQEAFAGVIRWLREHPDVAPDCRDADRASAASPAEPPPAGGQGDAPAPTLPATGGGGPWWLVSGAAVLVAGHVRSRSMDRRTDRRSRPSPGRYG